MTTTDRESSDAIRDVRVTDDRLVVDLVDGRILSVPLAWFPRLLAATPEQRAHWQLSGGGFGIHWPDVGRHLGRPAGFNALVARDAGVRACRGVASRAASRSSREEASAWTA